MGNPNKNTPAEDSFIITGLVSDVKNLPASATLITQGGVSGSSLLTNQYGAPNASNHEPERGNEKGRPPSSPPDNGIRSITES